MTTLWRDVSYGLRLLRGSPGFASAAVLTLAVGIAVNTTVFGWLEAILLRPLPGTADGNRIVTVESIEPKREGHNISYGDFRDFRDNLKLSTVTISLEPNAFTMGEGERAERVWGELVAGNYFEVMGSKPHLGRFFLPEERDDKPGAHPLAVISYRLWRSRFQSDRGIIGRTIRVNRNQLTVIGVAPQGFAGTTRGLVFDMWVPLTMAVQMNVVGDWAYANRTARMYNSVARLKPGVRIEQARAEMEALAAQLARTYPNTNFGIGATLLTEEEGHNGIRHMMRAPLRTLMAMCAVVLLIACVNVANLLLARSASRQKELSLRAALGATQGRLARQMMTEALLLAVIGAAASIPLAMWLTQGMAYVTPKMIGLPIETGTEMSTTAAAFTSVFCLAAALLCGLLPALHAMRPDAGESLKEGGRGGNSGARSHRMRNVFVAAEIALATVCVIGAGLFLKSFRNASAIETGFDAQNVLVSRFYTSSSGYTDPQRKQFCRRLRERLAATPEIGSAAYADTIPLGFGLGPGARVEVEGYTAAPHEDMTFGRSMISPGYFHTLRIPVLEGREFSDQDRGEAGPVIIVNQAFARRFFGGRNPVGHRVRTWNEWRTVVGLVRDSKYYSLSESPRPYLFFPFEQGGAPPDIAFYARSAAGASLSPAVLRREAAAIDPDAGAAETMQLADYISGPLFPLRMAASLMTVLGLVSLLLAAVGIYSVMAYAVSERTQEIGIRMALGAEPAGVLRMVVRNGMRLAAAGLAAGIACAFIGTQWVTTILYNVSPRDPLVFAGAAAFLALIALAACAIPARRATRIEPMNALRCQ